MICERCLGTGIEPITSATHIAPCKHCRGNGGNDFRFSQYQEKLLSFYTCVAQLGRGAELKIQKQCQFNSDRR